MQIQKMENKKALPVIMTLPITEISAPVISNKTGKIFWIVNSFDDGYLIFDQALVEPISNNIGKNCEIEVMIDEKGKKITKFIAAKEPIKVKEKQSFNQNLSKKDTDIMSFCVSYAIRLYETDIPVLMQKANSLEELQILIEKRKQKILLDAIIFYNFIFDLISNQQEKNTNGGM